MAGSDLTPAPFAFAYTAGDKTLPTSWALTLNGAPWTPDSASAMVRRAPDRRSGVVLELAADITAGTLTVGDGDTVPSILGSWYWSVSVVDASEGIDLTLLAGEFVISDGVS